MIIDLLINKTKHMKHLFLICTILLLCNFLGFSQSFVWKIKGKGTEFYIGGSIHILRDQDYPLPKEFYEAYDQSDVLTTELDMNEMKNPSNSIKMQQALIFQDDRTLSGVLSKDVYNKLDSVSNAMGVNLKLMEKLKPSMVVISLSFQSLQKLGVTTEGVDTHFTEKAVNDKKSRLFLESFDEQLGFIKDMGEGNEDEFVLYSIEDIEKNEEVFTDLLENWKKGQQELLNDQLLEFKSNYPDVYNTLVLKRNNNWMMLLEKYMDTAEIEFVVVGAMHLVGKDGLLAQLKKKGYEVSQL